MQNNEDCDQHTHPAGIRLVTFRWAEIGVYFTISAFVIIAGFAKLGFHKLKWLSSKIPESCLLILLGLFVSLLIYLVSPATHFENETDCGVGFRLPKFTPELFFFVLLPPVILDSAYSLHDRVFLDNIGTILMFAVVGTLINVFTIGGSLYAVEKAGLLPMMNLNLTEAFVYSSLISAVDPVAVLAIFQEIGVNNNLYFLIFGESLLNDGVTIVLYNTMEAFRSMKTVAISDYLLAILSFLIVSVGGISIGIFYGLMSALVTKWTISTRVVEPLAVLCLAYLSYITAELFHFSGIISLIVCGLIQAHYCFYNISQKSYTCVKYFTKMASATSDAIIFLFLGAVLVNEDHQWNTGFVLWSLLFCLFYRFLAIFSLSVIANRFRTKPISVEEMFIASYGGLRGAVAFSLAMTLSHDVPQRNVFIFTTLMVVIFTVFLQGITIRPLVKCLKIQTKSLHGKTMIVEITERSMDHMMAGIEEILGHHGDFYLMELIMHYNEKYFKKWFLHEKCDTKLTRLFEKISLTEHYAHLYASVAMTEDLKKPKEFKNMEDILITPLSPAFQTDDVTFRQQLRRTVTPIRDERTKSESWVKSEAPDNDRRVSIKSIISPIKSFFISSPPASPEESRRDTSLLRRALKENTYNKLHYKYNRNLVNEEDQELSNHLSRRSMIARRISYAASAKYKNRPQSVEAEENLPGQMETRENGRFRSLVKSLIVLERYKSSLKHPEFDDVCLEDAEAPSTSYLNSEDSEGRSIRDRRKSSTQTEEILLLEVKSEKPPE